MTDTPHHATGTGTRSARIYFAKTMTAATLALVAGLFHASVAGHSPWGPWMRAWQAAQPVPGSVNTAATEGCPIESPEGHHLFMASNRAGNLDIWVSYRASGHDAWGVPGRLPALVNSDRDDFCPTPLTGGRLLFVSARESACGPAGNANIYETRLDPVLGWLPPQILPCGDVDGVNSAAPEFSPSLVEAEGRTILFFSSGRSGTQQIYTSERDGNGQWGPAAPVEELNSRAQDARPNVSHDGLEVFFDSTRDGGAPDIWTARRSKISKPWSEPVKLGENVNSDAAESRPSLSRDGRRLSFGSTRNGGQFDIYVSTRFLPPGPPH